MVGQIKGLRIIQGKIYEVYNFQGNMKARCQGKKGRVNKLQLGQNKQGKKSAERKKWQGKKFRVKINGAN